MMCEMLGWAATVFFLASYFVRGERSLLALQCVSSLVGVAYGLAMHGMPIVVSNVLAVLSAGYKAQQIRREK